MSELKNRLRALMALTLALILFLCAIPAAVWGEEEQAEPTPTMETVSSYPYTTVTKVKVNLRAGRSVRSELLRHIPAGAEITVKAVKGSWAEVEYKNISGYVMTEYIVLKRVGQIRITPTPTPAPTLSPEEDAGGYQILQKGSEGSHVTALQEALYELGYIKFAADGKFGAGTEKAVIAFQTKNEYPATGIMDPNIQAFLYTDMPKNASGVKTRVWTLSPVEGVAMRKNNRGSQVRALQNRLIELGYLKTNATGVYDTNTIGAVRSFQKKNGMTADGTAGAETQKRIYSATAVRADETPTPVVTGTPTPTPTIAVPTEAIRFGDQGEDVKTVQRRLKELGYYKSTIDGKFGRDMQKAVKAFQEANGLPADGVAGPTTYDKLFSSNAIANGATPTPAVTETPVPVTETPAPTTASWPKLKKGDRGDDVAQLQEALIQLRYLSGKADGNYGDKTVAAVKAFQKKNGLTADGVAGEATQKKLYSGNALPANDGATPTPTPSATPAPTNDGTLRLGSKGPEVKALQKRLIELKYLNGKADGVYGAKTVEAVKAFQKANRLRADGVAGPLTLSRLNSTQATPTPTATPADSNTNTTSIPAPAANPSASRVQYANWYDKVKAIARKFPYATVYDFTTGISWQVHLISLGAHADYEPVTANDTVKLLKAFGGNTWNPKAVWVVFSDGSVYIGSTHSMPHDVYHIRDNNFNGHSCLHFPRTQAQVQAIGPYATKHQAAIDAAWAQTLQMR